MCIRDSYHVLWDKSDNALEFADNAKAVFGNSSDLQIHHNSSTGADIINSASYLQLQVSGTEYLKVNSNGATITGTCTAGTFSGSGASLTNLPAPTPAGSDTQIQFNNSGSFGGSADLTFNDSTNRLVTKHLELNDTYSKIYCTTGNLRIRVGNSASPSETINMSSTEVTLLSGGSSRFNATASGVDIVGSTHNIYYDRAAADFRLGGNIASWGTSNQFVISMPASQNDKFIDCKGTSGSLKIRTSASSALDTTALTIANTGAATFDSTVSDGKGNLRSIPSNAQSSAYVAVAADAGKAIYISTGGVTINNSVFSAGDAVTIINNSGSDQTITKGSGVTLYNTADATDANRTLAQRGMATIWFASASVAYISGAGLS